MISRSKATRLSDRKSMMRIRPILKEIDNKIKAAINSKDYERCIRMEVSREVDENLLLTILGKQGYTTCCEYYLCTNGYMRLHLSW